MIGTLVHTERASSAWARAWACVAAVGAALALGACGGPSDDAEQVQEALTGGAFEEFTDGVYVAAAADCPDDLELQAGQEFECELTLEQQPAEEAEGVSNAATVAVDPHEDLAAADIEIVESNDAALEDGFFTLDLADGSLVR